MPTKKPRGQELTGEQQRANQARHHRRLRIEPVHSSVKRCRIVKDLRRLWKEGIHDLVAEQGKAVLSCTGVICGPYRKQAAQARSWRVAVS